MLVLELSACVSVDASEKGKPQVHWQPPHSGANEHVVAKVLPNAQCLAFSIELEWVLTREQHHRRHRLDLAPHGVRG